jgi:glyceraldehyde 3-phosphate dehydrogenase
VNNKVRPSPENFFIDWKQREALAEGMIPVIGKLYRDFNVSCYMYGKSMVNKSVTDLMKSHRFVRQVEKNELSEFDTAPMLNAISQLRLGPAHIDIGKLVVKFQASNQRLSIEDFVSAELADCIDSTKKPLVKPQDVVLYGFGRIGRLLARLLIDKAGGGEVLRLRAIVVRKGSKAVNDLEKRAALLRQDSVHGSFKGTIRVLNESDTMVVNGNPIQVIYSNKPEDVDYSEYKINEPLIIDNTGIWTDRKNLERHLSTGAIKSVTDSAYGR